MVVDVSVVIPTSRRERQVLAAVASALAQTGVGVEVVVVDDSPEGSARAPIATLSNAGVRYLRRPSPSGGRPAIARNEGAAAATGRFIHFLDADDLLCPGALADLTEALDRRPGAGIACGTVSPFGVDPAELERERAHFSRAAHTLRAAAHPRRLQAALLFGPSPLHAGACVLNREAFRVLGGFDTTLDLGEDVELYARLARRFGGVFVDRPVLHHHAGTRAARARPIARAATYRVMHARYRRERGITDFCALGLGALLARLRATFAPRPRR